MSRPPTLRAMTEHRALNKNRHNRRAHTKATRHDWLDAAKTILITEGIERVKILTLANALGVSRSSFYWYFKDRDGLLDDLLESWRETNTAAILERAAAPAEDIFEAITNIFECWVDERLYDPRLDFAIREWARRSSDVRKAVDAADQERVMAMTAMYERHGYAPDTAFIRARVLYFMQIGYYALELGESMETRMRYIGGYLEGFAGQTPAADDTAKAVARLSRQAGLD